jgi:CubicO group peptidase (beta-lactamase class C family)
MGGAAASTGGAAGAGGVAPQPDAGNAGTSGADSGMPNPVVTECNGMALPPRAVRSATPHAIGPAAAGLVEYWPTTDWQSMDPAMLGFDTAKLNAALSFDTPFASSQAILVVRHGYVAAEEYFGTFGASTRHESFSMAKSFSSALVGIAIEQGLLTGIDEKLCTYYPTDWDCNDATDPRSRITIEHAMNISTGLRWNENWRTGATGPNDALSFNMLATALSREAIEEPGTRMRYSTGDPALLSGVLQGATGMTALEYARDVLFGPIGIPGVQWSGSGGRTNTYANLQATAREYAKFGYLFLNRGAWDGEQIVPAEWVDFTTQGEAPCDDWYRYLWHQNPPVRLGTQDAACDALFCTPTAFVDLPPDTFFAEGINGQFIFIVPSADMVVVRLANDSPGSEHWDDYAREFLTLMLEALL